MKKFFGIAALVTLLLPASALAALPKTFQCAPYDTARVSNCVKGRSGLLVDSRTMDLYYQVRGVEWLKLTTSGTTLTFGSAQGSTFNFDSALTLDSTLTVAGAVTLNGPITGPIGIVSQVIGISFSEVRKHDNISSLLPTAGAGDDMGLVQGTAGTNARALNGVDFGGTTTDEKMSFEFVIPSTYEAGSTVTIRFSSGMLTTVSDGTATLDLECWVPDYANADGSVSSDLVTPAAQSINSLTFADIDFVVDDDLTGHALEAGSVLDCRTSFAGSDTTNAGVMIPAIRKIDVIFST